MKVILFIFLLDFGWHEFDSYSSFEECKRVKSNVLYPENGRMEGFCCLLTESKCTLEGEESK